MALETGLKFCHNFMVVIDTNCFEDYSDTKRITPYCACNKCHTFFVNKKDRKGISPGLYYITESVFGEIIQQRQDCYVQAKKKLVETSKALNIKINPLQQVDFKQELEEYLRDFSIEVLPHPPKETFHSIISRALEKRLPFKAIGDGKNRNGSDKGFKDVLLWESLLNYDYEATRIGKLFLLTANLKDFPVDELLPEWKEIHPDVELFIIQTWDEFIIEEQAIFPELVAQNNVYYPRVLEIFQEENSDIVELPNYKKKITGRINSPIVEIETDVKRKDGSIYSATYYYDIKISDVTLIDPDTYNDIEELENDSME